KQRDRDSNRHAVIDQIQQKAVFQMRERQPQRQGRSRINHRDAPERNFHGMGLSQRNECHGHRRRAQDSRGFIFIGSSRRLGGGFHGSIVRIGRRIAQQAHLPLWKRKRQSRGDHRVVHGGSQIAFDLSQ